MPHQITKLPNLQLAGPVIQINVLPPSPIVAMLRSKGAPIPAHKVIALIDTGASGSCIAKSVADALKLVPNDFKKVMTAGGADLQASYDVGILLPVAPNQIFNIQVLEAKLEGQPYQMLLGRDILRHATFVYHGWDNSYTIHL